VAGRVLGVTDMDLYAGGLNFVFGMAETQGGAAVISVARLRLGANHARFQARTLKEAVHELGHTFGLPHCPRPQCVMHFSNSLADTDRKGADFCPECLAKLARLQIYP
jgi:archaemetzincin